MAWPWDIFSGKLNQRFQIGGETEGWFLQLDSVLELKDGKVLHEIKLEPKGKEISVFVGKHVEVVRSTATQCGPEKGIVIETIREI